MTQPTFTPVMAGLDPAIHASFLMPSWFKQGVDRPIKSGDDEVVSQSL
jgi:hypothetical protein